MYVLTGYIMHKLTVIKCALIVEICICNMDFKTTQLGALFLAVRSCKVNRAQFCLLDVDSRRCRCGQGIFSGDMPPEPYAIEEYHCSSQRYQLLACSSRAACSMRSLPSPAASSSRRWPTSVMFITWVTS